MQSSRSRSHSRGPLYRRARHPLLSPRTSSPPPPSHAPWTMTDESRFRATPRAMVERKLASVSAHNTLGALELRRKLGDLQGACFSPQSHSRPPQHQLPNRQPPRPSSPPPSPSCSSVPPHL